MIPGFFQTRSEVKNVRSSGGATTRLVSSAADINRNANSPDLKPAGDSQPAVYILGDSPTENDDTTGKHFSGSSGQLLRALLPAGLPVRWNFVVRTRPTREVGRAEVEYYRQSLVADIEKSRPKVLLGVGPVAIDWALPNLGRGGSINVLRGRKFPVRVGKHQCWFFPVHAPSWIVKIQNERRVEGGGKVPGTEWTNLWKADVRAALRAAEDEDYPRPFVSSSAEEHLIGGVRLFLKPKAELAVLKRELMTFAGEPGAAFDFETNALRPYAANARLLTASVGANMRAIAFPWDEDTKPLFLEWLLSPGPKIAHNLPFEQEWLASEYGPEVLRKVEQWEDTQAQAYVLDERKGAHGLNFCCRQYFGLSLKEHSLVNRSDLEYGTLETVLRYNALDSKYTYALWQAQRDRVKAEGLRKIYKIQIRRMATAVLTQRKGLLVDVPTVEEFQRSLTKSLERVSRSISEMPSVRRFIKRRGQFNPTSGDDLLKLLKEEGVADSLRGRDGKYSTDEQFLSKVDHPVAAAVLEMRKQNKLITTYVDRMNPAHARSYVYPDGRIHPEFSTMSTDTGRWSSSDPNAQNFPKRKNAIIRSQVIADPGCVLLACDYGQLEARVIASLSGQLEVALSDIHQDWAERLAKLNPRVFKKRGGDMKAFRSDIKNQFVFPLFYGATVFHMGKMMELPDNLANRVYEEFWDCFPKVRRWQSSLLQQYSEFHYVEGPTGRRRRAPLSSNEVINTPVQGAASDIVVEAMNRLSEHGDPHLQPVLNIHDDITLCVPEKRFEKYKQLLLDIVLQTPYKWWRTPIQVELSCGKNWYDMKTLGKFNSAA